MTNDVIEKMISRLFGMLSNLLARPMLIHYAQLRHKRPKFESKDSIDLWQDIPPVSYKPSDSFAYEYQCVIVPRQIEESAFELGMLIRSDLNYPLRAVYGQIWALSEGQTLEEEIEAAKCRYMIDQEPFSSGEDSLSDDSGFDSLSEDSEDDDFSEYDDEECPDCESSEGSDPPE